MLNISTKNDLIESIRKKVSSRLRVDGLDYLRDHNKNNYYDENNDEIIELDFENLYMTNENVTKCDIFGPSRWRNSAEAVIYYNVTQNTWSFAVETKKTVKAEDQWSLTKDVDLTKDRLQKMDEYIFDIEVAKLQDELDLEKYNKKFPVGTIIKSEDCGLYFYVVTKAPYRVNYKKFEFVIKKITETGNISKQDGYDGGKRDCSRDKYKISSMEEALAHFRKSVDGTLRATQEKIAKAQKDIEQYNKLIAEARKVIENSEQSIAKANDKVCDFINTFNKNLNHAVNSIK